MKSKGIFALLASLALMCVGAVFAINTTTSTSGNSTVSVEDVQYPNYVGTVKAPQTSGDETSETQALVKYAKITAEQAKSIALSKVSGKVTNVGLENENGYVVYSVEISTVNGIKDVKVDAGNEKILNIDSSDPQETGKNKEVNDDGKDGDKETNDDVADADNDKELNDDNTQDKETNDDANNTN
ncbi:PepSY domain-containing protein [Methanococcus aeolicus]|uniref:PepSY domain-containing protein n=1 Tax=Methanococcus aeolicus TaxID=42879 RepID=UPI0021C75566|nr:PepSY domain-containing protein [Methanococcus aeolicus]UXM85074.1 PepSY domain-containing protein [Methanococcus aeolicus]